MRPPQLGRWLLPLLALKLLAWVAASNWPSADARYMHYFGRGMTRLLWDDPVAWGRMLLADEFHYQQWYVVYHGLSNTFLMFKLLSVLNLASLGSLWLNGLYLSVLGFVACWTLVRTLGQVFPQTPTGAALVGFLGWPTVVYWSAGITKESLVVSSAATLVALVLQMLYGKKPVSVGGIGALLLLAVVQFHMRYFFAALLLAAVAGLIGVRLVEQLGATRRWLALVVFTTIIGTGVWVGNEVSLIFRPNRITAQLLRNYNQLSRKSVGKPTIVFAEFQPTAASAARNAPQAAWETLSRPWLWEGGLQYRAAGLENLLLLAVLAVAILATLRGRPGQLPFAVVLTFLFYCLALAVLLGLSTPNLGTLNRYRAALLPFVLWLALQNDYAARQLRRLGV